MKYLRIMRSLLFESDELVVRTLRDWQAEHKEDLVCVTYGDKEISALAASAGLPCMDSPRHTEIDILFIFSYTSCEGVDEYYDAISTRHTTYWFNFDKRENLANLDRLEGRP